MKTGMANRLAASAEKPAEVFKWLVIASLVVFVALYVARLQGSVADEDLVAMGNIATAVGLLLVGAGVVLAAAALAQSARGTDLRVEAARNWLVNRRRMVAALDYAMFSSPYTLGEAGAMHQSGNGASKDEVVKSTLAIVAAMRRLRDALAAFPDNQGFILTHRIMQDSITREGKSSGDDAGHHAFNVYLKAHSASGHLPVTNFLRHGYPWMFGFARSPDNVELNPRTAMMTYARLMAELDYLDQRATTFSSILEEVDRQGGAAAALCAPSQAGADMQSRLIDTLKNIYCYVAVFRAYLEYEWSKAIPERLSPSRLEDKIASMLSGDDDNGFMRVAARDARVEDNLAGYRYGHALVHLAKSGVFDEGVELQESEKGQAPAEAAMPSRMKALYCPSPEPDEDS